MILSFRNFFCAMVICSLGLASLQKGLPLSYAIKASKSPLKTLLSAKYFKISRLESGRHGWTSCKLALVSIMGAGYFLKDRPQRFRHFRVSEHGKTNIDVGCMQLTFAGTQTF